MAECSLLPVSCIHVFTVVRPPSSICHVDSLQSIAVSPRRVDSMIRDARTKKVYTVWLSVRRTITVHDGLCDRTSTVLRPTRRSSWTRTLTTRPYNTASVKATSQTCFSHTSPRASRKIITLHPCRLSLGHFNF